MRLLISLITYNRLDYTKKTLRSLWHTIEVPYYIVIVDNASTDGTAEYLQRLGEGPKIDKVILNPDNYYPGRATNIGWEEGLKEYPDATHLMRLDNDMKLEKGWDTTAEEYFHSIPELGQLGLDHEAIEHPSAVLREMEINGMTINTWPGCVGGPCIVRRSVWDEGLRYDELRWDDGRNSPLQEDSQFSKKIKARGYLVGHMTHDLGRTFANASNWHEHADYYKKTMTERGYGDKLKEVGL
jgi:glycosyltransferase involved in cell wall biosynthesis